MSERESPWAWNDDNSRSAQVQVPTHRLVAERDEYMAAKRAKPTKVAISKPCREERHKACLGGRCMCACHYAEVK